MGNVSVFLLLADPSQLSHFDTRGQLNLRNDIVALRLSNWQLLPALNKQFVLGLLFHRPLFRLPGPVLMSGTAQASSPQGQLSSE